MKKVVTLGEIMLRLSPKGFTRFVQAEEFDVIYGGGEANVAVSLANFGNEAYFVSKLPDNPIGQSAVNHLRRFGVHTDYIVRGGERVGIYYAETGVSMRPSTVVYDRKNSAISGAKPTEFDFDEIFKDADWFHFSGITPAISQDARELALEACKAAKKHGVIVSVDLNFRKKMWTSEQAIETMTKLMEYVDVCIGNEEDAEKCLGFKLEDMDITAGEINIEAYRKIFDEMIKKFGFKYVISSLRESFSASDNGWSAAIYDGKEFYRSKRYEIRLVDRIGGGDSFAAGVIHGLVNDMDFKTALEFGVAASALKQTIYGDFNHVSVSEVKTLMEGDASGRVQR